MDARQAALEEKLAKILQEAAELGAQIQAIEQGPGTPHYDQIESHPHETGKRLSRMMQQTRMADVVAEYEAKVVCPECARESPTETRSRQLHSGDGPLDIAENAARCSRCRRDFFPSA